MVQRKKTKPTGKPKTAAKRAPSKTKSSARRSPARTKQTTAFPQAGVLGIGDLFFPPQPTAPPHVLVFLPGWLGSKLADDKGNIVWLDPKSLIAPGGLEHWLNTLFGKMLDLNLRLKPVEIIQDILGHFPYQQQYGRLKRTLQDWRYDVRQNPDDFEAGPDDLTKLLCYMFPYDWRQDNRKSAQKLKEAIEVLRARHPNREIWLMGHSNGGIVARWYLNKLGGNDIVKRLILLASPWDGSPSILYHFLHGFELFGLPIGEFDFTSRISMALRMFPSAYQIMPLARNFMFDVNGQAFSTYDNIEWLTNPAQKTLLDDARQFNAELGNELHVPSIAFIGYNKPTLSEGHMLTADPTRWEHMTWKQNDLIGDGTVLQYSAEYKDARRFYVIAEHSDIYVNKDLQDRLHQQLLTGKDDAIAAGVLGIEEQQPAAAIEIELRTAKPGERVRVTVNVTEGGQPDSAMPPREQKPLTASEVSAKIKWLQGPPAAPKRASKQQFRKFRLRAVENVIGQYSATFQAPTQQGYYELETNILVAEMKPLTLRNTILVSKTK